MGLFVREVTVPSQLTRCKSNLFITGLGRTAWIKGTTAWISEDKRKLHWILFFAESVEKII